MKLTFNKKNWPLAVLLALFIAGRMVWGSFDYRQVAIMSEGARLGKVEHTFWFEVWTMEMPDGTTRNDFVRLHWYFLPVLLMGGMLVKRRDPS
jgi:hypothetical protein